jgi:outer membrane immunogenic protein
LKLIIASVAIATALVSPAVANEASNFGGFKVGVVVGYDNVALKADGESANKGGFVYGATGGYDYDLGKVVIGAEAEVGGSTVKQRYSDGLGDTASLKAGRDLYAGVRVGAPVANDFMIYAKGGYTNARVKATLSDGVDTFSGGKNLDGYRVGAGVEYNNRDQLVRVEYRYSDYGNVTVDGFNTGLSAHRHQVVLTAGWNF